MNSTHRNSKVDWIGLIVIALLVSVLFVSGAFAQSASDDKLLSVHVDTEDGVKIDASLPFSVIEMLIESAPKQLDEAIKTHKTHVLEILAELKKMEGRNLVAITGQNNVKIGVLPWKNEDDDFITLKVAPGEQEDDIDQIDICLPKGLVSIALAAVRDIDLKDHHHEIGKIVEEVMRAVNQGMEKVDDQNSEDK